MLSEKILSCWNRSSVLSGLVLAAGFLAFAPTASAQQTWHVQVGAESHDQATRVDAFLPNDIWIYAGDSIKFMFSPRNEAHTVILLEAGQAHPLFGGSMTNGDSYIVKFPRPGNYRLLHLVHSEMYGVVHVLQNADSTAAFYASSLPYDPLDYQHQAAEEMRALFAGKDDASEGVPDFLPPENVVLLRGEIVVDAEGGQYLANVHFLPATIRIHAGETVEWINTDPMEPHTVTFGPEPMNPQTLVTATHGPDGALQATVNSTTDDVSSGFLEAAGRDRSFLTQSAPGGARIRVKFTKPGTYHDMCDPHDTHGTAGKVIVLP